MASFSPPAGVAGPVWTTTAVQTQIAVVAANDGVPATLANAIAQQESGFNPYARGDVQAGQPTSFGLYQLHEGGELESLPGTLDQKIAAAYVPSSNAKIALAQVGAAYRANPGGDPGTIAATAQRPGNPSAYAAGIDDILGQKTPVNPGGFPTTLPTGIGIGSGSTSGPSSSSGPFGSGTTTYQLTPLGPSITIWSWPRIAFALFGGMLVLLGLYLTFRGSSSSQVNVQVQDDGAGSGASSGQRSSTIRSSNARSKRPTAGQAAAAAAEA